MTAMYGQTIMNRDADQDRAIDLLRQSLASGHRRPVLQAATGWGKTQLASKLTKYALEKGKRVTFVVPALSLVDQTVEKFWNAGLTDVGVIQANHVMTDWSKPVQVASVQTLAKRGWPKCDIVLNDECHRFFDVHAKWMTDPEWQTVPFIGLSATPWTKGLANYYDDLVVGGTISDGIAKGYLSPFRVFAPGHVDLTGVRTTGDDYNKSDLSGKMNTTELVADVVETWLRRGEDRPTFCFAVDRGHAKHLEARFTEAGVTAAYQDAETTSSDRAAIRRAFHDGSVKVVCSVGTLTTGVDWDVRCIVLARPTKSAILFCLDSETEILTSAGWRGIGQVREGDCAAALQDIQTGKGCWSPITGYVERTMEQQERWVSYKAPRCNFRVTDQHRMVFRTSRERPFQIAPAVLMATYRDGVQIPSAVTIEQPGVPLTNDELYFIGMMMTDGTWTVTGGSISQSERYPEIVDRIEKCLHGCGIGYAKRRVASPRPDAAVGERHARWCFYFSAGKPKPHPHRRADIRVEGFTGYRHLLPFMDKDFATPLMAISRAQFLTLLQGIYDGDGQKLRAPSVDWTPRSWTICSGRKVFVDRLQALAAINGFTAHSRSELGNRKNPIFYLTITPQDWRNIGGCGKRPQITVTNGTTTEKVWCVQTQAGTIVTRRQGKVTVMGNCQMIGRGLRVAEGKQDCLIFDHSDSHQRLGFVTDIGATKLDDGKIRRSVSAPSDRLPKECPQCACLKPVGALSCPECGFTPSRVIKPRSVEFSDGQLEELTKQGGTCKVLSNVIQLRGRQIPLSVFLGALKTYAQEHRYKDGWAAWKYKSAVGSWPPRWMNAPPCMIPDEVASWIRSRAIAYAKSRKRRNARETTGSGEGAVV